MKITSTDRTIITGWVLVSFSKTIPVKYNSSKIAGDKSIIHD